MRRTLAAFFFLMGLGFVSFGAQLKAIDIKQENKTVFLYFSFQNKVTPKIFRLSKPDRLVVDLKQSSMAFKLNQNAMTNALIKRVRSGYPQAQTLRLVFELSNVADYKHSPWHPANKALNGFKIELTQAQALAVKAVPPPEIAPSPAKKIREAVVVIDAGHGGKDPGARGSRGSQEKNIVLSIALKLKHLIDKQPGMRAVLTRKNDNYIGLRQRLTMARRYNADVFVAIHADAFINRQSHGASVFALSPMGATSEAARWLAEKENYSELGGVDLSDLDDQNGVVRSVLIDLSQTATIAASLQMGKYVLNALGKMTRLHHDDVEQARFVVLKSPDIPSILVETGFISNPREEKNLNNAGYQQRLSHAIFQGIKNYFMEFPPHEAYTKMQTETKNHVVHSGETLSSIAARYHTSLSRLCAVNHFSARDVLKIGQKLIIPS